MYTYTLPWLRIPQKVNLASLLLMLLLYLILAIYFIYIYIIYMYDLIIFLKNK